MPNALSIGTVFSKKVQAGPMGLPGSHNAQSRRGTRSFTSLKFQTKLEPSGITHIIVRWFHRTRKCSLPNTTKILATQYCDGLRGALVVYDLLDPHRFR